ncbi:MAG TPA: L,D-transpeptidase family protein [Methylocystis sp.]|jgi:murein L,D-transpeptidase YcbB/YkuD
MRRNAFAGALLLRAALLSSSFIVSAALLAQDATPQQPIDQNNTPQQPVDQNNETAPRQERGPSVSENVAPDLGPETVRATAEAARRYMEIAARGGWPRIARPLHPGAKGGDVARLRRRLGVEGYLGEDAAGRSDWDEGLTDAVKRFQANHGLDQTGDVSRATLRELNIPAAARAKQLEATAQRLSRLHFHFPRSYVAVNIAGASVEAVEDGKAVRRFTAIVGGKRHESPRLTAKIVSVDINPTWTVPVSIIKKEMAPRLRRDPNYLARQHIRVLDGRGREVDPRKLRRLSATRASHFTFRQDPGAKNALGSLRLSMPNKDDVYMHDTPQKELFDRDYRFLSHGCVRVEGVYDLAAWLLNVWGRGSEHWDNDKLRSETESGRTEKIRLAHPAPVFWVYLTGWAEPDGIARFRRDIYGLDKGTRLPPAHETPVALRR